MGGKGGGGSRARVLLTHVAAVEAEEVRWFERCPRNDAELSADEFLRAEGGVKQGEFDVISEVVEYVAARMVPDSVCDSGENGGREGEGGRGVREKRALAGASRRRPAGVASRVLASGVAGWFRRVRCETEHLGLHSG